MRFFILSCILLSLSVISCGKRRHSKHEHHRTPDFISDISIGKLKNRQTKVDIGKMFILVRNNTQFNRKVHFVCRSLDGCLHICDHFNHTNFDHASCKQLSVKQVINFWINKISEYHNWEPARKDLKFIATNKDVANFLKAIDKEGRVIRALLHLSSEAMCPIDGNLAVRHTPLTSLYLIDHKKTTEEDSSASEEAQASAEEEAPTTNEAPEAQKEAEEDSSTSEEEQAPVEEEAPTTNEVPEAQKEAEEDSSTSEETQAPDNIALHSALDRKKIVDGSVTPFDFPIFFSFIKKCFGAEPVRTFTQLAVEIENRSAFEIAHQALTEACSNNNECIRLAYCNMDSDLVWDQLDEKYKQLGCSYDSFVEVVPPVEESTVTKKQ